MNDFEFLSSNLLISYPFSTPAPTVTVGVDTVELDRLFADALLFVKSSEEQRIALKYFKLDRGSGTVDVTLTYEDGTTLAALSSGSDTARIESYGRWIVAELTRDGDDPVVARFVLPDTVVDPLEFTVAGAGAIIEPSLITRAPNEVKKAYLKVGANLYQLANEITLEGGYNFDIAQLADQGTDARPLKIIQMAAPPGGGIGPFVEPADQTPVRTLAGAAPTVEKGNIDLVGTECYTITPISDNNEVELRVICGQCCSCEDYVTVYEGLKALWDQALQISGEINDLFALYKDLVERISIGGGGADPVLRSRVVTRPNFYLDIAWLVIIGSSPLPTGTDIYVEISIVTDPLAEPPPDANYIDNTGELIFQTEEAEIVNPTGEGTPSDPYEIDLTSYDHDAFATTTWTGTFQASMSLEKEAAPTATVTIKLFIDGSEVDSQEYEVDLLEALPID